MRSRQVHVLITVVLFTLSVGLVQILPATATAAPARPSLIGLERLPELPTSRRPADRPYVRRAMIAAGELAPRMLVPMPYHRRGRVTFGKYYDERGNVLRFAEVQTIVTNACPEHMGEVEQQLRLSSMWSTIASVSFYLVGPFNVAFIVPSVIHWKRAKAAFAVALLHYNRGECSNQGPYRVGDRRRGPRGR